MIDWYSVEYLYPSSFKEFTNVMFPNVGVLSLSTLEFYDVKKLYYFFDKEGVRSHFIILQLRSINLLSVELPGLVVLRGLELITKIL